MLGSNQVGLLQSAYHSRMCHVLDAIRVLTFMHARRTSSQREDIIGLVCKLRHGHTCMCGSEGGDDPEKASSATLCGEGKRSASSGKATLKVAQECPFENMNTFWLLNEVTISKSNKLIIVQRAFLAYCYGAPKRHSCDFTTSNVGVFDRCVTLSLWRLRLVVTEIHVALLFP